MDEDHKTCDGYGCEEPALCTVEEYKRKYVYCLEHGLECITKWMNQSGEKGVLTIDSYDD